VGRRALILVVAALLLAGCGGISSSELEEEAQARGGGLGETAPLRTLELLEDELGEAPVFTGINVSWQTVVVTALVPGTDDALDTYTYLATSDRLLDPTPVSGVEPPEELAPTLMEQGDLALDDLDEIIDDALERTDLDGGYASNVGIHRSSSDRTTITVSVTSPRRDATVTYRGNGEFVEVTPS
jgi:hypothetical protein